MRMDKPIEERFPYAIWAYWDKHGSLYLLTRVPDGISKDEQRAARLYPHVVIALEQARAVFEDTTPEHRSQPGYWFRLRETGQEYNIHLPAWSSFNNYSDGALMYLYTCMLWDAMPDPVEKR